jgi:plastocyanin
MRVSRFAAAPVALAAVVVLGGCGGDDDDGGGGRTVQVDNGSVTVEAHDVSFDVGRIETAPGPLEVTLVQRGNLDHTLVVEGVDDFKLVVDGDDTDTGTVELDAGEYDYYCDVPGHRGQGMEGTLVVG